MQWVLSYLQRLNGALRTYHSPNLSHVHMMIGVDPKVIINGAVVLHCTPWDHRRCTVGYPRPSLHSLRGKDILFVSLGTLLYQHIRMLFRRLLLHLLVRHQLVRHQLVRKSSGLRISGLRALRPIYTWAG